MADSTAIAIVSVSVTAAASVGSLVIANWLEGKREARRVTRERRLRDTDELRELLDETVQMLHDQVRELVLFEVAFADPGRPVPTAERAELGNRRKGLGFMSARLAIRLGRTHLVTSRYEEALQTLDQGIRHADFIQFEDQPREDLSEGFEARAQNYRRLYDAFVDAAEQLVGFQVVGREGVVPPS
jgi:hypothetical protein